MHIYEYSTNFTSENQRLEAMTFDAQRSERALQQVLRWQGQWDFMFVKPQSDLSDVRLASNGDAVERDEGDSVLGCLEYDPGQPSWSLHCSISQTLRNKRSNQIIVTEVHTHVGCCDRNRGTGYELTFQTRALQTVRDLSRLS